MYKRQLFNRALDATEKWNQTQGTYEDELEQFQDFLQGIGNTYNEI